MVVAVRWCVCVRVRVSICVLVANVSSGCSGTGIVKGTKVGKGGCRAKLSDEHKVPNGITRNPGQGMTLVYFVTSVFAAVAHKGHLAKAASRNTF